MTSFFIFFAVTYLLLLLSVTTTVGHNLDTLAGISTMRLAVLMELGLIAMNLGAAGWLVVPGVAAASWVWPTLIINILLLGISSAVRLSRTTKTRMWVTLAVATSFVLSVGVALRLV